MTKQTKIKHYTKRDYAAFAYLAPWIIGMLILQLYPFLSSLVYSFCNYKITGTPKFCGLLELFESYAGLHAVHRARQTGHGFGCGSVPQP